MLPYFILTKYYPEHKVYTHMETDKSKLNLLFDNSYLRKLIIPLIIETLLSVCVGIADIMMVSQAGDAAVSGVSIMNTIQELLVFLLTAFATGGSVVASQMLGQKSEERARRSAKQLLYISISFSFIIALLLLITKRSLINLIYGTLESEVFISAISYITPILISMPFLAIQTSCSALSRSMGRASITMVVSIIVNLINIAGNAVLLFGFDMGAAGVGYASLISRIIGAVIMFIVLLDKKKILYIQQPFKAEIDVPLCSMILKIALPSGLENSIFYFGKIFVSSTIASLGTASIAADAILNNIGTFANIPGSAIGMASITIIGQCCGAKLFNEASYYSRKLLTYAYVTMGGVAVFLYTFTPAICNIYSLSPEATRLAIEVTRLNLIQSTLF